MTKMTDTVDKLKHPALSFGGIPVSINPYMPKDEIWLVIEGKKLTVLHHEGQRAGETFEEWLRRPQIHRIINLGNMTEIPKFPPGTFVINKPDTGK